MSFTRLSSSFPKLRPPISIRCFSSSNPLLERAVVYARTGDPSQVLRVISYPPLSPPAPGTLNVKFLLSPINPADINVIEGVYPARPAPTTTFSDAGLGSKAQPAFVGGNEGLAQVTALGEDGKGLEIGDWVVMGKPQLGTWCTSRNVGVDDVIKVPNAAKLSRVHAATLTVNPPTAYNMIHDFVPLRQGDWLVQNGANSAVGQAVIQIARAKGFKTLNFVRSRDDLGELDELVDRLKTLGADEVVTYDELSDKTFRGKVKEITGGKPINLGLNCVGGPETSSMAKLLGSNAHLVSYGAMSKKPLSLPTSLFIFKNLTSHGFWQSRWSTEKSPREKEDLLRSLTEMMIAGELNEPKHAIVKLPKGALESEAGSDSIRGVFSDIVSGKAAGKVLLQMD